MIHTASSIIEERVDETADLVDGQLDQVRLGAVVVGVAALAAQIDSTAR
ncbi:hypothetical protein [Micromonospora sp. LH3U1]|nr:hypothetical protein [Micromonospora sp. LH3U1]WCN79563.1 hypothetical protein PCA76_21405 [Micromonospora sp. LH3U1]